VREFQEPSARARQVSRNGGCQPRWSRSGDELFFVSGSTLYSASSSPQSNLLSTAPIALFQHAGLATSSPFTTTYDASPDGQTFVLVETLESPRGSSAGSVVRVVENWWAELDGPTTR
jgi:hypothetical protein